MVEGLISLAFLLAVLAVFGTAAWAGFSAAPWVPLRKIDVHRMIALAHIQPGERVVDLGAGDGRLLFAAAKAQGHALGFEISVLPYLWTKTRLALSGMGRAAQVRFADFYAYNLKDTDVILAFLTPMAMEKLKSKFEKELKTGARVVSYAFSIPGWTPKRIDKPSPRHVAIYLYLKS